jgi:hypothetical protein
MTKKVEKNRIKVKVKKNETYRVLKKTDWKVFVEVLVEVDVEVLMWKC